MSNLGERAMEILDELHTERLAYESEYVPLADAANLLTAYEETGLAPEDILSATDMAKVACALHELNQYKELGDLSRLRDLVEADRDGRCVVLPCKPGCILRHDGRDCKADHWNISLTAFSEDASTKSGEKVHLFSVYEAAEAALKGEQNG